MRLIPIAAGLIAVLASGELAADPSRLLVPADPAYRSGWQPPASPTADLKAYDPVDAKGWPAHDDAGKAAGPMKGMPGMEPGK